MEPERLIADIEKAEAAAQAARSRALDAANAGDHAAMRKANAEAREADDAADTMRATLGLMRAEHAEEQRISAAAERNAARKRAVELVKARERHAAEFDRALQELSAAYGMIRANSREIEKELARAGDHHTGLSGSDVVNVQYSIWQDVEFARSLRLPNVGANHRQPMRVAAMRRVPAITLEEEA
jgi:hypothetical protein